VTAQPWTFGQPSGPGDQFNARDHLGHFVAFVQPSREEVTTKFGDDEITRCRYVVCLNAEKGSQPHPNGLVHDNAAVFGTLLVNAYSNGDHQIVLGWIAQAEAKAGQNPAFILNPAEPEDETAARAWFDANASVNAAGNVAIN
jgi:hypothetical protein